MSERRTFTVRRATWLRGAASWQTAPGGRIAFNYASLLTADGRQCCLGFVAEQCGVPRDALYVVGEPEVIERGTDAIEGVLVSSDEEGVVNTELSQCAMEINDDREIDDAERERRLTALFAQHGYTLAFVDGDHPTPDSTDGGR